MKDDELAREVEYMELQVRALQDYANELTEKGNLPFSSTDGPTLLKRGSELVRQLETTRKDVSGLAERHEWEHGDTPEGAEIKQVGYGVAGEVGSLSAIVDLATGEPRDYSMAGVGKDFIKASETLKRLAAQLGKVQIK